MFLGTLSCYINQDNIPSVFDGERGIALLAMHGIGPHVGGGEVSWFPRVAVLKFVFL